MTMEQSLSEIEERIFSAGRLWLFLDYDGTLAEFAPTPDHILPDSEVIAIIRKLASIPSIRLTILSGRRISHVLELLPVDGIFHAGTYGIEIRHPESEDILVSLGDHFRSALQALKPKLAELIRNREGFYLEDKGFALAIHARQANDQEADAVLSDAVELMQSVPDFQQFRILGGHKFVELGPQDANKGKTVERLTSELPLPNALLLYIGDDDKDEEAFAVIRQKGGIAVLVSKQPRPTIADTRLNSPRETRQWLVHLADQLGKKK